MEDIYRLFAGIKRQSENRYVYALSVLHDDRYDQSDAVRVDASGNRDGFHRATLMALIDGLEYVLEHTKGDDTTVHFHAKNDSVAFEYNSEYIEDGFFSSQTADQDLWEKVVYMCRKYSINLEVYGNDSVMTGMTGAIRL